MAQAPPSTRHHAVQIAGLVLTFGVLLNAAFYFLSDLYFDDRAGRFGADELARLGGVRLAFAMFTASVGVGSVLASFAPRLVGHGIAVLAGLLSLIGGGFALQRGLPPVLGVTMFVVGVIFPVLVWRSLVRSRGAWAFLIALCAVYSLVLLFGAPKVRGLLGIGLWHALIIPGLLAVAAAALVMVSANYRDVEAKAAPAAPARPAAAAALSPEDRQRKRKAGVATMAIGLVLIIVGMVLVVLPISMGMAATFVDFGLVLAGVISIIRGYLHIPRP